MSVMAVTCGGIAGLMAERTVLLTGAAGLLGTWLRRLTPSDVRLANLAHRTPVAEPVVVNADLRDRTAVLGVMRAVEPALVIHAAYAKDETSIVAATRHVVEAATVVGADVVHISTDVVFCGDGAVRGEDDDPDPVIDYGRWKAAAERVVMRASSTSSIVRLPLVVSLDPDDHVIEQIRAAASRNQPTAWFDDELRQPAAAEELAEAVWRIAALDPLDRAGAWQLPGPEQLSRHQVAQRVITRLDLDPALVVAEHRPPSTDRPRHIRMSDDRAQRVISWSPAPVLR
jgi:dTDP-4-dehydrorhamnose reductase